VFLNPAREALKAVIDARFEAMLNSGAWAEVESLLAQQPPLPRNLGVMKAHGVPHLVDALEGRISRAEAVRLGQGDTRAYARRQVIFARRYLSPEKGWIWAEKISQAADCLP
jgi:tRNA dimethylallyltransferase